MEDLRSKTNGVRTAMSNAVKSMSNRSSAEAASVGKEVAKQSNMLKVARERRMAEFAAMKPIKAVTSASVNRGTRLAKLEEEEAAEAAARKAAKAARNAAAEEEDRIEAKKLANRRAARGFGGSRRHRKHKTRKHRR